MAEYKVSWEGVAKRYMALLEIAIDTADYFEEFVEGDNPDRVEHFVAMMRSKRLILVLYNDILKRFVEFANSGENISEEEYVELNQHISAVHQALKRPMDILTPGKPS